ncbi:MAG: hypothetical protein P8X57_11415 [Cyclobacteriaceae bacterium]
MKYFLIFTLCFTCLIFTSQAQKKENKREGKKEKRIEKAEQDNSFAPFSPAQSAVDANDRSAKGSVKKTARQRKSSYYEIFNRRMDQKIVEFQQRMKENAREERRKDRALISWKLVTG